MERGIDQDQFFVSRVGRRTRQTNSIIEEIMFSRDFAGNFDAALADFCLHRYIDLAV